MDSDSAEHRSGRLDKQSKWSRAGGVLWHWDLNSAFDCGHCNDLWKHCWHVWHLGCWADPRFRVRDRRLQGHPPPLCVSNKSADRKLVILRRPTNARYTRIISQLRRQVRSSYPPPFISHHHHHLMHVHAPGSYIGKDWRPLCVPEPCRYGTTVVPRLKLPAPRGSAADTGLLTAHSIVLLSSLLHVAAVIVLLSL